MEYLSIDRIEGDIAVCENDSGDFERIPAALLPDGAQEGEVVARLGDGSFIAAREETERRRAEVRALEDDLFG